MPKSTNKDAKADESSGSITSDAWSILESIIGTVEGPEDWSERDDDCTDGSLEK